MATMKTATQDDVTCPTAFDSSKVHLLSTQKIDILQSMVIATEASVQTTPQEALAVCEITVHFRQIFQKKIAKV